MTLRRTHRPMMLWLWALLMVVCAQALIPVGWPPAPPQGSAFTAGTIEVSLGPTRSTTVETQWARIGPDDTTTPHLPPAILASASTFSVPAALPRHSWPQAPPGRTSRTPATTAFDPRGPPLA